MPWYAWLIIAIALLSVIGGLMFLRDTAHKIVLTDEQRKRVEERNAEMDAKDAEER
jgi:heme exporter protein D